MKQTKNDKLEPSRQNGTATIGFRLDDDTYSALAQRAEKLGVSPHELARSYVFESLLEGKERAELRKALVAQHRELTALGVDVAQATEAISLRAPRRA